MSDLYKTDALAWSEQQAALLRHVAEGERTGEMVDWPNVIDEIEATGRAQLDACESLLGQALLQSKPLMPEMCPYALDDLLAAPSDVASLVAMLDQATTPLTASRRRQGRMPPRAKACSSGEGSSNSVS